jgi:hypothetical protein
MIQFDRIGDFNPQLLRELKSRLSWRNGLLAIAISLIAQVMLLLSQFSKLPTVANDRPWEGNRYCLAFVKDQCTRDDLGNILINWPKWWGEVAVNNSWLMVYGLIIGGVYLLASSFSQEEKRGTLNFIRLTPQKASTIFVGKLLGVPALVYLGAALALPLQFYATRQGGISLLNVLSWDILMMSVALLLYLGAILATLWFNAQSILLAGLSGFIAYQVASSSLYWHKWQNYNSGSGTAWYGLPIANRLSFYLLFAVLTCAGIYWLYRALERRYAQAQSTVLSKAQSYGWTAMLHLFMMGFYFYSIDTTKTYAAKGIGAKIPLTFHPPFSFASNGSMNSFADTVLGLFGWVWLMLLIPLLLPNRQSLIEWSRYHSARFLRGGSTLFWVDRSPAVLAVALNVVIASLIWIPMIYTHTPGGGLDKLLLGTALTVVLMMLYSSIAHWVLFWPVNNRPLWTTGIIGGLVMLPVIGASLISFGISSSRNPLFLLSPFVWTSIEGVSGFVGLLILGLLCAVTIWVNMQVRKSLQKVGRSESFQHLTT